jgi:carboxypeptidase T
LSGLAKDMAGAIKAVHGVAYVPEQSSQLYRTAGDTTDWTYGTYAIPSFTIELRPSSAEEGGFVVPASQIEPTYQENRAAAFLLIDRLLAPGAARPADLTRSASKRPRRRG